MRRLAKLILPIVFCAIFLPAGGHLAGQADAASGNRWHFSDNAAIGSFTVTAIVQGAVYVDANHNGQQDDGEGLEGATVALFGSAQSLSAATLVFPLIALSGSDGAYRFDAVTPGDYTLTVTLQADSAPIHSQALAVGSELVTTVDPIRVTTDSETQAAVTVQGTIYIDANDNNQQDDGEGIEGASIALFHSTQSVSTATLVFPLFALSGPDGRYRFDDVPPGEYTLTATLQGASQPFHSQTLAVGTEPLTTVAPIRVTPAAVQGTVYMDANGNGQQDDGEGIEGATVALFHSTQFLSTATLVFPLTTVSGSAGYYRIDGVPPGEYTLTVTLQGESQPIHSQTIRVEKGSLTTVAPIAVSRSRGLYLPAITNRQAHNLPDTSSPKLHLPSVLLAPRCPSQPTSRFGVQMYGDTGSASPYYTALRQSGASWLRVAVEWASVEPQNTTPDRYRWASADAAVAAATEACLTMIGTHTGNPIWAAIDSAGRISPQRLEELSEYLGALVERYDGDGIADAPNSPIINYWEMYNEPDAAGTYSVNGWGNHGDEYAEMLELVYPTIKNANPNAKVLLGGLAYDWFVDNPQNPGAFVRDFLDEVLKHGGGNHFDIMNFHSYPAFAKEWTDNEGPGLYEKTAFVRAKLQEYGLDKPIMITESGWHSSEIENGATVNKLGTPELQARYIVALFTQGMAQNVQTIIYWMLHDLGQPFPFASGSVTNDSPPSPKPAFAAYQVAVDYLGMAHFRQRLTRGEIEAYQFYDPRRSQPIYVSWLNPIALDIFPERYGSSKNKTETLKLPASRGTVRDIYGNVIEVLDGDGGSSDGAIRIRVSSQPVYIIVEE